MHLGRTYLNRIDDGDTGKITIHCYLREAKGSQVVKEIEQQKSRNKLRSYRYEKNFGSIKAILLEAVSLATL